ncbi:hypothetical protein MSPP1_001372 [Malassezia sp. CBS 17886]|nr:hypothetical protein MSPP1_001372 [Malassezia sp. CBS 17886]
MAGAPAAAPGADPVAPADTRAPHARYAEENAPLGLGIEAAPAQAQARAVVASVEDVVRKCGWLLLRRAQLVQQGVGRREPRALVYPLVHACREFFGHAAVLRDQLSTHRQLCAQVHLERALEHAHVHDKGGLAPAAPDAGALPGLPMSASLSPMDPMLYNVISTMPLSWGREGVGVELPTLGDLDTLGSVAAAPIDMGGSAAAPRAAPPAPGSNAATAIPVDNDDDDADGGGAAAGAAPATRPGTRTAVSPLRGANPAKRRRVDGGSDTASSDLVTLIMNSAAAPGAPQHGAAAPSAILSNANAQSVAADTAGARQTATGSTPAAPAIDMPGVGSLVNDADLSWLDMNALGGATGQSENNYAHMLGVDGGAESSLGSFANELGGLSALDFPTDMAACELPGEGGAADGTNNEKGARAGG